MEDNELITLEMIHHFVEILDRYFGSVSQNAVSMVTYLIGNVFACQLLHWCSPFSRRYANLISSLIFTRLAALAKQQAHLLANNHISCISFSMPRLHFSLDLFPTRHTTSWTRFLSAVCCKKRASEPFWTSARRKTTSWVRSSRIRWIDFNVVVVHSDSRISWLVMGLVSVVGREVLYDNSVHYLLNIILITSFYRYEGKINIK